MTETVSTKKKRIASLDKKKARSGWLFVLPFVIGFVLVYIPIVGESLYSAFCQFNPPTAANTYSWTWIGFQNFYDEFYSAKAVQYAYAQTLVAGLRSIVLQIPAIVIFSLFMAILLNQKMAGRAVFRAIFFIPVIISTGFVEAFDTGSKLLNAMSSSSGINDGTQELDEAMEEAGQVINAMDLQKLLGGLKLTAGLGDMVINLVNNVFSIVSRSGVQMLIFLAGLQSISPAIYESCQIDGATAWETFWKITFPMISPMILVNTIYTIIDSFTSASNIVMNSIKNNFASSVLDSGLANAMYWTYFAIIIGIIAIVAGLISAYVFYQRRD